MPPAAALFAPRVTVLPAAAAAVTTAVGNVPARWCRRTRSVEGPDGLLAERLHLIPDRHVGVVEDVLGDRDDDRDLLDVEVLVAQLTSVVCFRPVSPDTQYAIGSAERTGRRTWLRPTGTCVNWLSARSRCRGP
jgi:hypothetical protein